MSTVKNNLHQHLDTLYGASLTLSHHGFHYESLHQRMQVGSAMDTSTKIFEFRNPNMAASVATLSSIGAIDVQSHRQEMYSPSCSNRYTQNSDHHGKPENQLSRSTIPLLDLFSNTAMPGSDVIQIQQPSNVSFQYSSFPKIVASMGPYESNNHRLESISAAAYQAHIDPIDDIPDSAFLEIDIDSKLLVNITLKA